MKRRILAGGLIAGGPAVSGTLCLGDHSPKARTVDAASPGLLQRTEEEVARVEDQMTAVIGEIRDMREMLRAEGFETESDILSTHLLMLEDPNIRDKVKMRIEEHGLRAEEAVAQVFGELKERLRRTDNAMTTARSADVEDLMQRLQRRLSQEQSSPDFAEARLVSDPVIVLPELLVSQVVAARDAGVRAVIVEYGTPLSHAAIIAKAFSIPILRVSQVSTLRPEIGATVVVDVDNGRLVVNPEPADLPSPGTSTPAVADQLPTTPQVRIWLNVVDDSRPDTLRTEDVQGVGLYRSEFLLTGRTDGFPSENEQVSEYRRLCSKWVGYPITIRTFDIGGDKVLPFFSLGPQANPYLGLRAHRVYRFHPELLVTQIRAILRASVADVRLRILYPMIETVDDLIFVQDLVMQAIGQLEDEGVPFQKRFEQGVLIEVPSAVWTLPELLDRSDFVSVGTNDLLQYHFAVDRGNPNVSSRCRPEHPSALRMLKHIADAATRAAKRATVCGELAADPRLTPLLLGLGFSDVSVDVNALGAVSRASAGGSIDSFRALADSCLGAATMEEVRVFMDDFNGVERAKSRG